MTANTEDSNYGDFFASTAPPENFGEKKEEIQAFLKLHEDFQGPVVLVTVSVWSHHAFWSTARFQRKSLPGRKLCFQHFRLFLYRVGSPDMFKFVLIQFV